MRSFQVMMLGVLIPTPLKRPFDELKEIIEGFSPDVVGISLRNIDSTNKREVVFYYSYLKKAIDEIKAVSNAKIIVGGSGFPCSQER